MANVDNKYIASSTVHAPHWKLECTAIKRCTFKTVKRRSQCRHLIDCIAKSGAHVHDCAGVTDDVNNIVVTPISFAIKKIGLTITNWRQDHSIGAKHNTARWPNRTTNTHHTPYQTTRDDKHNPSLLFAHTLRTVRLLWTIFSMIWAFFRLLVLVFLKSLCTHSLSPRTRRPFFLTLLPLASYRTQTIQCSCSSHPSALSFSNSNNKYLSLIDALLLHSRSIRLSIARSWPAVAMATKIKAEVKRLYPYRIFA